jgi:hypothetical protein
LPPHLRRTAIVAGREKFVSRQSTLPKMLLDVARWLNFRKFVYPQNAA